MSRADTRRVQLGIWRFARRACPRIPAVRLSLSLFLSLSLSGISAMRNCGVPKNTARVQPITRPPLPSCFSQLAWPAISVTSDRFLLCGRILEKWLVKRDLYAFSSWISYRVELIVRLTKERRNNRSRETSRRKESSSLFKARDLVATPDRLVGQRVCQVYQNARLGSSEGKAEENERTRPTGKEKKEKDEKQEEKPRERERKRDEEAEKRERERESAQD